MTKRPSAPWAQPFLSTTLWTLVLIDIAAMTVIENQPFFAPYVGWAWPSVLISAVIGYIAGPPIDSLCRRLMRRQDGKTRSV